jgi:bifunctional non-homologous end joining protein LigD
VTYKAYLDVLTARNVRNTLRLGALEAVAVRTPAICDPRKGLPRFLKAPVALPSLKSYVDGMVSRTYGRGRPLNAPAAFIHPCQPEARWLPVADPCPRWAGSPLHDQWSRLVETLSADCRCGPQDRWLGYLDAEVVWIGSDGAANFDALHSRVNDQRSVALAFDLMSLDGEDFRQEPFSERKAVLRKVLRRTRRGIQYVEHTEGDGGEMFKAVCKLGLEASCQRKWTRLIGLVPRKPGSMSKIRKRLQPLTLSTAHCEKTETAPVEGMCAAASTRAAPERREGELFRSLRLNALERYRALI